MFSRSPGCKNTLFKRLPTTVASSRSCNITRVNIKALTVLHVRTNMKTPSLSHYLHQPRFRTMIPRNCKTSITYHFPILNASPSQCPHSFTKGNGWTNLSNMHFISNLGKESILTMWKRLTKSSPKATTTAQTWCNRPKARHKPG